MPGRRYRAPQSAPMPSPSAANGVPRQVQAAGAPPAAAYARGDLFAAPAIA